MTCTSRWCSRSWRRGACACITPERADFNRQLIALESTGRQRGYLTEEDVSTISGIATKLVQSFGYDPRTQEPPRNTRPTVPEALSVRNALLTGDADELCRLAREAQAAGYLWAATHVRA